MKRSHVARLAKKHRYIMYIMLNVAKRSEGMGLKLMKFHAIIHMVENQLDVHALKIILAWFRYFLKQFLRNI